MNLIKLTVNIPPGASWQGWISDNLLKKVNKLSHAGDFKRFDIDLFDQVQFKNMGWYKEKTNIPGLVRFLSNEVFYTLNYNLVFEYLTGRKYEN